MIDELTPQSPGEVEITSQSPEEVVELVSQEQVIEFIHIGVQGTQGIEGISGSASWGNQGVSINGSTGGGIINIGGHIIEPHFEPRTNFTYEIPIQTANLTVNADCTNGNIILQLPSSNAMLGLGIRIIRIDNSMNKIIVQSLAGQPIIGYFINNTIYDDLYMAGECFEINAGTNCWQVV